MHRYKLFERITIAAALTGLVALAYADDITTLPPVRAVASNLGNNVICYGYECAAMLEQMMPTRLFPLEYDYLSEQPTTVDQNQFCANLNAQKPTDCNINNPPSTPLTDTNWQPNGCGDGSLVSDIAEFIVASGYPETGGISLDQPSYGINFKAACDVHDRCYGSLLGKTFCDNQFRNNMGGICANNGNFACNTIADAYFQAVDRRGGNAYERSTSSYKCVVWSAEMKDSQCRS